MITLSPRPLATFVLVAALANSLALSAEAQGTWSPAPIDWSSDSNWSDEFAVPQPDDDVLAIETLGDYLVIGGKFRQIAALAAPGLARWNGIEWQTFPSSPRDPVTAMLVEGNTLVVACTPEAAGTFTHIEQWDGAVWTPLGTREFHGSVQRFLRWNGQLVISGVLQFPGHGNFVLARFENGAWTPFGPQVTPSSVNLNDAAAFLGDLYVGGSFGPDRNHPLAGLLRLRAGHASFDTLANSPAVTSTSIQAMAVEANDLVVGGSFRISNGISTAVHRIMSWSGTDWKKLDDGEFRRVNALRATSAGVLATGNNLDSGLGAPLVGTLGPDGWVMLPGLYATSTIAVAEWRGRVVTGGQRQYLVLGGPTQESGSRALAMFNGSSWTSIAPQNLDGCGFMDSGVWALLEHNGEIAAGGQLGYTWDGDAWRRCGPVAQLVDHRWRPLGDLDGIAYSLSLYQGQIYAAGTFTLPSGVQTGLVRFDGSSWTPIAPSRSATFSVVYDDKLIVAGRFDPSLPNPLPGIAAFDGTNWSVLGPGPWAPDSMLSVSTMLSDRGFLYAAGCLVGVPGVDWGSSLARWDGKRWSSLGSGVQECPTAIAAYGDGIAIGGYNGVQLWDGTEWNWLTGVTGGCSALASDGPLLFLGGSRSTYPGRGGLNTRGDVIAVWDGASLHSLGSGIEPYQSSSRFAAVLSFASRTGSLVIGGDFHQAGTTGAACVASWRTVSRRTPPSAGPPKRIEVSANPSRLGQSLEFVLPAGLHAQFGVFDLAGRRIRSIPVSAGSRVVWDGRESSGKDAPAGIYFARVGSDDRVFATRRIVRLP